MDSLVEATNVDCTFPPDIRALENFNIRVGDGEFVALVGPCGSGKSVALRLVAGLERPTKGEVYFRGKIVQGTDFRRALVFQQTSLYPWMTILENAMFGPLARKMKAKEAQEKAIEWLNLMGLAKFQNSYPYELSGGLQRRAFLACILVNEPDILLCDEPFGALDWFTRKLMANRLVQLWYQKKFGVIYVTHAVEEAVYLAQKVYVMTTCPGTIKEEHRIDLPEKRWELGEEILADKKYAEYVEKIRSQY